ncbi:sacsin [Bombina bombina]|uniref:sacsin n=1 Tax=Bombina bombina TaxID=8345 RepID=UPI00235A54E8|nr:sacsin [Bombina bombina]
MDFFQRSPPFLIQLQNILRKYPDGGQILKELIQNADDARASEVIFIYDEREYGTEKLSTEELHTVQGPALLAYNNQTFTDHDWKGIQEPGNSIKRKDPNTVGKFGLGFNSVYHITDYPAIFSGKNIGILDPQETIFHRGGRWWSLEKHKQCIDEELADQFHPFQKVLEDIGKGSWNEILNNGYFEGTLFRFPLRFTASEISDNLYNTERIQELFDSFISDASLSLLFLRHVRTVSMKRIDTDGSLRDLLTVSVSTEVLNKLETSDDVIGTCLKVTSLKGCDREEEDCKWLVVTSLIHGNMFPDLVELSTKLCNKASLDLAYPLTKSGSALASGRLSCFLPLPDKEDNKTGLPILINGSFDLTDDRRSMKWLEVDQQHDEAAKWNQILVEKLLPLVYKCAVKETVSLVKTSQITTEVAYGIWPDPERTMHKARWHNLTKKMAQILLKEKILQTADNSDWITAYEAVFFPFTDTDEALLDCLEQLLLLVKQPLVKIPEHIKRSILLAENNTLKLNKVSPSFIRNILRTRDWRTFANEKKMLLLSYILSDKQYSDLLNIQLLPLSDGTFTSFQNNDDDMVYLDSQEYPRILLPGLAVRFLPKDLPRDLLVHFRSIILNRKFKNLVQVDEAIVRRRLQEALPKTWQGGHNPVMWNPGDPNHPPIEWLSEFWHFLQRHFAILDSFENQPLVPLNLIKESSTDIWLVRLTKSTTLLFQSTNGHHLSDVMAKMLEQIGCTVIQTQSSWMWHKNLQSYILEPTPNNILKTFTNLKLESIVQTFSGMPEQYTKIFSEFLSQASTFQTKELEILYKLPIFCSVKSIGCPNFRLVAAFKLKAVERNTVPVIPDDLVFPNVLLKCRDDSDRILLQQMKMKLLNAMEVALLLVKAIQNGSYSYYEKEAQKAILWILKNGHILFSQCVELKQICERLHFIPCNGKLVPPSSFFDPDITIFRNLFDPDKFPPSTYQDPLVLTSLRTLGLKVSIHTITSDDVLQIAAKISHEKVHMTSLSRAKALINVCNNTKVLSELNAHYVKELCNHKWVPVSDPQIVFIEPTKLRCQEYNIIVQYSMPITKDFNDFANKILGLHEPPPPQKVVENLKMLSQQYEKEETYSLLRKVHTIYKYIENHVDQFHDLLTKVPIWNGEGFSCPSDIILSFPGDLDLTCMVKKVPSDFLSFKKLFIKCGVRKTLSEREVIQILYTLQNNKETNTSVSGMVKELKLSISIIDWMRINRVCGTDDLPIPVQDDDNGFSLKPLSSTLFCDMDKKHLNDISANFKDYHIVHEDVSLSTVKFLNIQLLSTNVLKPEFFEPWGPSEPVTLRIKNILRDYSEHVEVFKELIQNAVDAGATKCEFLVDMRQNSESRQSLIDAGMTSCHGPALWSYNNSKFSDEDFKNIIRIGAATKETQVQKIGKFGLGFNTVYHITDVPSIMSGSQVLIFDPNINHMKKHIQHPTNPGIKIDLQKNPKPLNIFADQFYPFSDVFGCELKQPFYFNGTLIRLPFRTEHEAKDSQILNQAFTKEQIKSLMDSFEDSKDTIIIFLKNIKNVTLHLLRENFNPKDKITKINLKREQVKHLDAPKDIILQQEQIIALKALGMEGNDITAANIIKVTVQHTQTSEEKYYLIQNSIGIKEAFMMFTQNKKISVSVPGASVAFPLKKNSNTGKWTPCLLNFEGIVFCFLPLPISSGLPFHVNGSFSVTSNRKSLWTTTEKGEWNKKLLSDAVIVALLTALTRLQLLSQNGDIEDYCYYTFWPDVKKANTQFKEVVECFYKVVTFGFANSFPAVFSNGEEYCTIKHACFLQLEDIKDAKIHSLAEKVFRLSLKKPYLTVSLPDWVKNCFVSSNCFNELLLNTYNWERFYREIVFENLESLDIEDRNALILHAIDMQDKELNMLLKSKPCIPSYHGNLQYTEKLVHPGGKVSILYDQEEGHFPQGREFLTTDRLKCLQHLGMIKDDLPIKDLMERAQKIKNVWKHDRNKALQKVCRVLELLNDLLDQSSYNSYQNEFRNIIFLPAFPPRKRLCGLEDLVLLKSTDLYYYKHTDLVCMIKPVLSKQHVKTFKFSEKLLSFLGFDQSLESEIVLLQLQETHKNSNLLGKQEIGQIAKMCYNYLNELIQKEPTQTTKIKMQTSTVPFVFVGQDFVLSKLVAQELSFEASPYLFKLPQEYTEFDKLWDCVGLCQEFSIPDYVSVLERMAVKHKGNPLPECEITIAGHTLEIIANKNTKIAEKSNTNSSDLFAQRILVPDQQSILCHVDKIYFNDTPWLPYETDLHFCHQLIPRLVAQNLGIKSKIHHTLEKLKVSSLSNWVSQFGAKEELTTRIKNIISDYSSKKDILKELIQNADDSNATEIHFVLDSRTHPTKCTFGPEWNLLQGPSLCIYNNKKFESKDIDGIQNIGIGGKWDCLDKTGKFGLGFNSVYHITDCPSFLTGDTVMCVFDPNLKFLPSSNSGSPGGMFTINNNFKGTFKDVYYSFLPSMFNLQEGTLFRLPLRMAETVTMSKISDQTVSLEDIRNMCKDLEDDADSMVLFLNNINTITFSEVSDTESVKEILSIKAEIDKKGIPDFGEIRVFYKMRIKCSSSKKTTHWIIGKQIGIEGEDDLANLKKNCSNLHQTLIPHGAVATCLNDDTKGRAFCTLPLPLMTELPVHISGNFIVDKARRFICREDGGSPKTEWNTFLLSKVIVPLYCSFLEHIQNKINMNSGIRTFKNMSSCKDILEKMFLRFFPSVTKSVSPEWREMVIEVYQTISKNHLKFIPVFREIKKKFGHTQTVHIEWSTVGQNSITEEPYFLCDTEWDNLKHVLQNINMKLSAFSTSSPLYNELSASAINILKLSPKTLCDFLRNIQLHSEGYNLPRPVCETLFKNNNNCMLLLKYCLKDCGAKKAIDLQGVPLLVTEDGMVQKFNREEPKYCTMFGSLFPLFSDMFAINNIHSNQKLIEYGFLQHLTIPNAEDLIKKQLGPKFQTSCLTLPEEKKEWLKTLWMFFEYELNDNKKDKTIQSIFELFIDWAILPVCYQNNLDEICLLSLASRKKIMCTCSSERDKCLFKLGFPKLETLMLSTEIKINILSPYLLNTDDCCLVLQQLCSTQDIKWEVLDDLTLDMLLMFFLSGIEKVGKNGDYLNQLQSLPLFETHCQKRQSLQACKQIYILNATFLLESKILYGLDSQYIFLKNNKLNKLLKEYISITLINDVDFVIEFLIPRLDTLNENEIFHLISLVIQIQRLCPDDRIINALKAVKLIQNREGIRQKASYFYDHTVSLFRLFGLKSRFVPKEFIAKFGKKEEDLYRLLLNLDMQSKASGDDIIQFATMIEKESKHPVSLEELTKKSEQLFKYFLFMDAKQITQNFTAKIMNIKFLLPLAVNPDLESIHPSYSKKTTTVALKGSLLKQSRKDELLIWTSMVMLELKFTPDKSQAKMLTMCGVLCTPPTQLVINNLKNVCSASCKKKPLLEIRSQVLNAIYTFLHEQENIDFSVLSDVPFILVDNETKLVEVRQVVFSLHNEDCFRPYLYKLPSLLACYSKLFQTLGVEPDATESHYAMVLKTIYLETNDKNSLHSNLKKTIPEATEQFFNLLMYKKSNDIKSLKPLYLAATDTKLYDSSNLVFNNCYHPKVINQWCKTLKFIWFPHKFDQFDQKELINLLPMDIRPKLLSQITKEKISYNSNDICTYRENCEVKCRLQKILFSQIFLKGLAWLLRSQSDGKISEEEALLQCTTVFGKLEIMCLKKLQTRLIYKDEPLDYFFNKAVFVEREKESHCQFYIRHNDSKFRNHLEVISTLAEEINNIMGHAYKPKSQNIIMEMLSCDDTDEITNVLNDHNIKSTNLNHHPFSLSNPGEPIPDEWYDSLDMSPLNNFIVGEYVGYMDPSEEECYLYAIVIGELDSKKFGSCEIQMYRINIGQNRIIDVSILDLYQFKRAIGQNSNALVLVDNPRKQEEMHEKWYEKSLDDTKKEIDQYLSKIWELPNDEQKKAIRRLYLKYHPDKNIGQEELSTEICKYIQQRISDLEAGRPFSSQRSSEYKSNSSSGFSNFWRGWDSEASHHRKYREHFTRKTKCDYNFWEFHSRHTRPNPEEARRWFRQAEYDLRAAENDVDHDSTEWVFYKIHQAVEKALFAAQYLKNGKIDKNTNIGCLAHDVSTYCRSLLSISEQVSKMIRYGVDKLKTQYPNSHTPPGIPHDRTPSDKEQEVMVLAKDVLQKIKAYVL